MPYIAGLGRQAPDYRLVRSEVQKILEENSIFNPPVSPREITENYGIKVLFGKLPEGLSHVMGYLDENQIVVNIDDVPNWQTYTIAHELGHARLHREFFKSHPSEYKVLMRQPLGAPKDVIEQEASAFAGLLLVPQKMLDKYVGIASQYELSKLFNVSEEVVRWRIKNDNPVSLHSPLFRHPVFRRDDGIKMRVTNRKAAQPIGRRSQMR